MGLLGNVCVVADVLREVKRDLPSGYYQELPRLTVGPLAGYPRILALGLGLVAHTDSSLNEPQVREFVRAYQSGTPARLAHVIISCNILHNYLQYICSTSSKSGGHSK